MDSDYRRIEQIVLPTLSELLLTTRGQGYSRRRLESIVARIAATYGASPDQVTAMVEYLPSFLIDLRSANQEVSENTMSSATPPKFEVWVDGNHRIVEDISSYEKIKHKYLIWIDLDQPGKIQPKAIKLLKYLVEHIGQRVPFEVVLKDVFDDPVTGKNFDESNRNKVEVQITAIHKFSRGQFRKHIFRNKFTCGLGLSTTFSDKYLIFRRL